MEYRKQEEKGKAKRTLDAGMDEMRRNIISKDRKGIDARDIELWQGKVSLR